MDITEIRQQITEFQTLTQRAIELLQDADKRLKAAAVSPPKSLDAPKGGQVLAGKPKFDSSKARDVLGSKLTDITAALAEVNRSASTLASGLAEGQADSDAPEKGLPSPAAPKAAATPAAADAKSTSFADFMQSIGQGIADAQEQLDVASKKYADSKPPMPALFRIPKLTAEMRFAINTEDKKGLGLVFYSKSEKAATEHQQSISFEIVSAPPPPELLAAMQREVPTLSLVLDAPRREAVFKAVETAVANLGTDGEAVLEARRLLGRPGEEQVTRDRVVLLAMEQENQFMAFAAAPAQNAGNHKVGIWFVDTAESEVKVVLEFSAKGSESEEPRPLKDFVNGLAEKQVGFLATLR